MEREAWKNPNFSHKFFGESNFAKAQGEKKERETGFYKNPNLAR